MAEEKRNVFAEWRDALMDHLRKLRGVLKAVGVSRDMAVDIYQSLKRDFSDRISELEADISWMIEEYEVEEEEVEEEEVEEEEEEEEF